MNPEEYQPSVGDILHFTELDVFHEIIRLYGYKQQNIDLRCIDPGSSEILAQGQLVKSSVYYLREYISQRAVIITPVHRSITIET